MTARTNRVCVRRRGFRIVAQALTLACAEASFLRKQAPAGEPPPHHANTARGGDPVPVPHELGHFRFNADALYLCRPSSCISASPSRFATYKQQTDCLCHQRGRGRQSEGLHAAELR